MEPIIDIIMYELPIPALHGENEQEVSLEEFADFLKCDAGRKLQVDFIPHMPKDTPDPFPNQYMVSKCDISIFADIDVQCGIGYKKSIDIDDIISITKRPNGGGEIYVIKSKGDYDLAITVN